MVAVLVVIVASLLVRVAPGDPARAILGQRATPEAVTALRQELDLNKSLPAQVAHTLSGVVQGDLGNSLVRRETSVLSIVGKALPVTLAIIGLCILFSVLIGVPLGLIGPLSTRPRVDAAASFVTLGTLAVPPFVLSLLVLLVLAIGLNLGPAGGWGGGWPGNLRYAWMPSLSLAGVLMPQIARTVRQTARELRTHDFIEAAESRGLSRTRIALRHVLPNSALPVVTVIGFNAAALLAGDVIVEAVFGLPGFGQVLVDAVGARDYPVIEGVALATALIVVVINLLTDVIYYAADPRSRVAPA